jgi:predicted phage baseplate assembly protein
VFRRLRIDEGDQYLKHTGTQGQTAVDDPAASATGLASQQVVTSKADVIEGTLSVTVDEGAGPVPWSEVEDFLTSSTTDRHFTVAFDEDGRATVTFGDGSSGKIPPQGVDNIAMEYRYGASDDGNVGAGTVTQNRSGVALISNVTNPRPATGWVMADGATEADLERVKVAGPASLRTRDRAVTADDCEELAVLWVDDDGESPVVRALAIEEAFGPKTVQVVVVASGGGVLPTATLSDLEDYFNGVPAEDLAGVLVLNNQATVDNYTPVPVPIDVTVQGGDKATIEAALLTYLTATATKDDGSYEHTFGGKVFRSKLINVVFEADSDVVDVTLTTPASDVQLAADELPTNTGSLSVTVT